MAAGGWRTIGALVVLAVGAAGQPLLAQAPRVERQGTLHRELPAGSATATAVFRVTNTSAGRVTLQGTVELPAGWRTVTPEAPFTLRPGQSDQRLVGLAVPASTPAGPYLVRYLVRRLEDSRQARPDAGASDSLVLVVPVRRRLDLQLSEAPSFVAAGNEYTARFLVTNRGNARASIQLELASGAGLRARSDAGHLELAPGDTRSIAVTVTTPRQLAAKLRHRLALRAVATADSAALDSVASVVEVIPRAGATGHRGQHLPVRLELRGSPQRAAAPYELSGAGPLSRHTRISFLARGSGTPGTLLAERDAYRLDFRSRPLDLRGGDQVFMLSPLTGPGRFDFGGSGRLELGPVVARGFAQWDRRAEFRPRAQGGYLGLRPVRTVEVGVNYLARADAAAPVWSARAQLAPAAGQSIDLEYGLNAVRPGEARAVTLRGVRPSWSYEVRHLRADSAYREPSGIAAQDFVSLALRPWRGLRLAGSASETEGLGFALATLLPGHLRQRFYRAELGYGATAVEYRRSEQHATGALDGFGRASESVQLRLGLRARRAWIQPFAEFGRASLGASPDRAPFRRLGLTAGVWNGHGSSASLSVESYHARRIGTTTFEDRLVASLDAALALSRTTRFRVMSQGVRAEGPIRQLSGLLDATLEQDLLLGHTIAARARLLELGGMVRRSQSAVVVEYAIPLRVPLPGSPDGARIDGRVYDAHTRRGVPNAVVRAGERVVLTDRSGHWSFTDVPPGTQRILLDPRSLGSGQIPLATAPLEVVVAAGARTRLDLGVAPAGQLRGRLQLFEFASAATLAEESPEIVEQGGVAGLIVELVSGTSVLRRLTDGTGAFEFSDLPAGHWTLTVAGRLPDHHYLERDTVELEIRPGRNDLSLRVLPRLRRVRMLTERDVPLGGAAGDVPPRTLPPSNVSPPSVGIRAAPEATARRRYTVTRFDVSLMYVARFMYGDASLWPKIWLANRHQLLSPDVIEPGQVLLIPEPAPLTAEELAAARAYWTGLHPRSASP